MRWYVIALPLLCALGCASTKLALEGERRVAEVQQAIFANQQRGLGVYLYRSEVADLEEADPNAISRIVREYAQQRDLMLHWAVQWERAKAYEMVTVGAKLIADQGPLVMLWKWLTGTVDAAWPVPEVPASQP